MLAARPELFTRTYTIADFAKVATSAAVGQRLRPSGGRPEDPVAVTFAPRGLEGYEDRPTFHIARQVAAGAAAAAAAATKATSCLTRIASRLTRGTAAASAAVAAAVAEEGNVANYLPRFLNLAVRIANHISGRKSFVVYDDRFAEVSTYSLGTSIHDDDLSLDMLVSPGAGWLTGDGTLLFEVVVYSFLDGVLANDQAAAARILTEHMNAIVLHWRHPPGVPSRAPHKVSISSPISRTDVRTYVIRDFPSVADLVPYKEAATLDDRLLNGRCTIRYYPNGQQTGEFKDGLRGSFLLAIRVAAAREEPVRGRYRIRVLNHLPHGRPASKEGTWTWKAMSELLTATGLLTAEILNPEAGWLSAAEKALVLEVEVTVWEGVAAEETVTTRQLQEQATRDLRYHIGTLLPGGAHTGDLFTDMEFRCEGRRFPAHRALLAARSPVFRAMFASAMQESRSGVVEVEDVLPAVLQELLHFLYTAHLSEAPAAGATGEAARWPLDLYAAAHRYQVNSLTRLLEGFLLAEVPAPEALVERLHFAGRFDELRSAVWGHYAALLQRQEDGRAYLRAVQASDAFRRQDTEALRTFLEVCTLTPPAAGRVLADSSAALVGRSPPRRYARKRRRCEGEEAGASEASEFEWRPRLLRVHVARMTAEELTAELEARDLSVLGAVDDLRARLDAALER